MNESVVGFVAIGDYYATGEGRTIGIALGCTEAFARKLFHTACDEYFLGGVYPIDAIPADYAPLVQEVIPPALLQAVTQAWKRGGWAEYSARMHINFS
jgi:hypothetical protein